ncbi:MAG: glycosyltransferase [Lachnospiraceae bacterium]
MENEKQMPLLSVAVACYKTEEFFERCLNSLFNSEYQNLEILLIDDGSPDNCPALCDEYAKKDSRIRVVHKENGGGFSAKNLAIDIATGDYFAICDNDDMVPADGYKALMEKAIETDADVVQGTVRRTNLNNGEVRLWKRNSESDLKSKTIGFQSAIYRTKLLQQHNIKLQPFRLGDDISFMVQVLNYADKVEYIDTVTYEYLIRPITSAGTSAIQMRDFKHYYDEFRWRAWTLQYINQSEKLMKAYGNDLGRFCMIIDDQWLSLEKQQREDCFVLLKQIVDCINWEQDSENIKGYLKTDLSSFQKMDETSFTKNLKKQLALIPLKNKIKHLLGR